MDPGPAVALLLGAIVAVQLLSIYVRRLFGEDADESESHSRTTPPRSDASPNRSEAAARSRDGSAIVCPSCGTENDRQYTFCRNCVAHLATTERA